MQQTVEHLRDLHMGQGERFIVVLHELRTKVVPRDIKFYEPDEYLLDCSIGGCEIFQRDNTRLQAKLVAKNPCTLRTKCSNSGGHGSSSSRWTESLSRDEARNLKRPPKK